MTDQYLLIIAYGNSLRRDDGAGLILAEILTQRWLTQNYPVRLRLVHQLSPELALDLAAPAVMAVLFVDAAVGYRPMVKLRPLDHDAPSPGLTHHTRPEVIMAYTELFGRIQPPAWLMTVTGVDFGHGETLSPAVAQVVYDTCDYASDIWHTLFAETAPVA